MIIRTDLMKHIWNCMEGLKDTPLGIQRFGEYLEKLREERVKEVEDLNAMITELHRLESEKK